MDPLLPARTDDADRAATAPVFHWYSARLAVALIVAALLGLLWVLHRQELDDRRTGLIRDVLWVEQNVQFNLERNVQQLRQLGQEVRAKSLGQAQLEAFAEHLVPNSLGLVELVVLDASGAVRGSAPGPTASHTPGSWIHPGDEPAYRLARTTGDPAYGPPRLVDGAWLLDVFVPYYRNGEHAGTVVGVYGLRAMLSGLVPWWLAEKHRVTIRDTRGTVLAARSNVEASDRAQFTHQVLLEPPGHGLLLHVTSYEAGTTLVRNVLAVAIVGLSGAVLWSMWALRRHTRRRLEAERQVRREHAFRKAMEDSLETGMRAVDLEGRIIYVNPAFCRMVGYSEEELIGHGAPQPYWPPEDVARIQASMRAARESGARRSGTEYEFVRRGGERFDALLLEAPLVDAQGRQTGWMGSVLDITERKQARERSRQQEEKLAATARLVTMGEMASAIAHELNQPLSAIASYTTGCLNVLGSGAAPLSDVREALEKTSQQTLRAGRIIRRVHEFVRKSEPARSRVRLHAVIDEAVGFAQAEARKRRVKIRSEYAREDVELDADPLLIQQVLLNLLRNGMEAMAGTPPEARQIVVATERADSTVTVRVADRGCGIAADVQAKLFEPFFTTKAEGMGMGLNICRSVVELHRGRVWAEPAHGGGTVFSFSLPLEVR